MIIINNWSTSFISDTVPNAFTVINLYNTYRLVFYFHFANDKPMVKKVVQGYKKFMLISICLSCFHMRFLRTSKRSCGWGNFNTNTYTYKYIHTYMI
jgi:hypothetical protein